MGYILCFEKRSTLTDEVFTRCGTAGLNLAYWPELSEDDKKTILPQIKYVVVGVTPAVNAAVMDSMPALKMILRFGTGVDNVDLAVAKEREICVANAPGANANSVAEMTIGLILSLYHRIAYFDRRLREGHWDMFLYRGQMYEMRNKVHGIVGMGAIGKRVAEFSKVFGTKVVYWNRHRFSPEEEARLGITYAEIDDLVAMSDIISLHVPGVPDTYHLIDERRLSMMKPSAILINIARGTVIDEDALAEALDKKIIAGAGLDTFTHEPVSPDSPLLKMDNFVGTPHEGSGSCDTFAYILEEYTLADITRMENGEEVLHRVV